MSAPTPARRALSKGPVTIEDGQWAARRINRLLAMQSVSGRYLEIGLRHGSTLERVTACDRWGVDPSPRFDTSDLPPGVRVFESTSDEFFGGTNSPGEFHVIYIDGLHHFVQTYRDLINSLEHLAATGSILIDDTFPCDEVSSMPSQALSLIRRKELGLPGTPWHGDVWKVVVAIATLHPELDFRTVIGSGNPQTLVWRCHGSLASSRFAPAAQLERILALEYSTMLSAGIPPLFRPCSEDDAMNARGAAP